MNQYSIFIFTNNDSIKLNKILKELYSSQHCYNINVIDDSNKAEMIKKNINLSSKFKNTSYLGRRAFEIFYKTNYIGDKPLDVIIGTANWNLGTARNFALDYSILNDYKKVLFIDDDISNVNIDKIDIGFKALTNENFVSCHLEGKIDDSIVGHMARQFNVDYDEPRMLSGGFWFLSPKSLNHRFYNIYNEDWILQLLENDKKQITLPFSVTHDKNKSSTLKEKDLYFQEIGEIIVEALLIDKNALEMESKFWSFVILERTNYIKEIIEKAKILKKEKEIKILMCLYHWLENLSTEKIFNLINKKHEREKY